ncbi:MAG: hypothetical protein AABY22_13885 [Nanoarchaeota archaeon]
MSYCSINNENKQHLLKLIDWLFNEVISSGGDGDALWYSKYFDVKDILNLIKEYNEKLEHKWRIDFDETRKLISWWDDQESVLITNNEEIYKSAPSWSQCIVVN